MSFLRLGALWALPLVLIPILVHLIHRRRHPVMAWPAMIFLKRAAQSRRGPAKLRRLLILTVRMVVVAAVVFALARPLSSGRYGLAASRIVSGATTLVLLDRSPSTQRRMTDGQTRQVAALSSLARSLTTLGVDRIVLIDSVSVDPAVLPDPDALLDPTMAEAADSTADVPAMMSAALRYLQGHDHSVADIWVCTDDQTSDWRLESPKWQQVRREVQKLGDGVRFHRLRFPSDGQANASVVSVSDRWIGTGQGRELSISAVVAHEDQSPFKVPVRISVGDVTSSIDVEVVDGRGELSDYRLAVPKDSDHVCGVVSIAADINASDDRRFFAASSDQNRPIGLVTEEPCIALEVASEVLGETAFMVGGDRVERTDPGKGFESVAERLNEIACLVWQGQLPSGEDAARIREFIDKGGNAVFFPPMDVDVQREFAGIRWGHWDREKVKPATFDEWEFSVEASCSIDGDVVALSRLDTSTLLIGKTSVGRGAAWFSGTDVTNSDRLFVKDGLVLYGLLSEALDSSTRHAGGTGQWIAGQFDSRAPLGTQFDATCSEVLLGGDVSGGLSEFGHHAGVFLIREFEEGPGRLVAINQSAEEIESAKLSDEQLEELIPGLQWNPVSIGESQTDSGAGFVREIWGLVWMMVIGGMLLEAWLSLPSRVRGNAR